MAAIPVFVSSTFRDFHGERDLLVGPVRERLDELVADLGCRVEMIDLRWGVDTTEDGEDEAQRRVLDVCLDQINRARPLFLGLAGERYGTVPDAAHARFVAGEAGVPADQVVEGRSITELEFGHGALWDSAPPGDHVILVRTIAGAVPTGWADANPDKVSRFRAWLGERARDRGSVQVLGYTATGTGSGVDLTALQTESGKVESFEDFVVQCLSRPVLARAREVIAQDERAGLDGPVRLFRDDREIMVGRDALRDQVVDSLAGRPSGRVLLLGSSGTGKSTLLCAVEAELRSRDVPVVSHLVGVGVGGRRPVDVVVSLAAQLGPMLGTELTVPSEAGSEDLRRWWSDTLSGAVGRLGSLVVVVDALDQIDGIDAQEVIWPVVSLPAGVGLLCSSTTPGHAGLLAPTGVETVPVGALSGPLAREAASRWALASGRSLPAPVLDVVGVEARLPLWVRVAVDLLGDLDADDFDRIADAPDQAAAIAGLLRQEVVALPAEPGGLAERLLDRVGDRVGSEVADQLVGLLAVARAGLSQADLVELLPDELGNRQLLVAQARRVLGGQVREQDAAGRLVFTHALVRQAALSRAPQDPHVLLARRLVAQDGYDRTGVLDLLWHVLHTAPDQVPQGSEHLAFALNTRVAGTELLFINALAVTSGAGLKVVAAVPPDTLTDTGLETLLAADERAGAERLPLRDRRVLAEINAQLARDHSGDDTARLLAAAVSNVGRVAMAAGDLAAARTAYTESLTTRRRLAQADPGNAQAARDVSVSLNNVGRVAMAAGDLAAARTAYTESLTTARRLAQADPGNAQAARDVSVSLDNVGEVAMAAGDLAAARTAYTEMHDILRRLAQADPGNAQAARDVSISLWRLAELTDEVAGKDSEAAVLAWREVALDFEELGRRGWLLPADERAEAHARSRARQASKDVGTPDASVPSGIEALLSARGLLLAPEAASSTIDSFLGELGERVGMCLSVLLTDDAQDNFEALLERPDGADQAAILLREAVPSQPDLIRDVQATLVDELADVATDGVIPPLGIWPVALPDFGTRAEVVLWCRGYRPPETELRAASDRINEAAERRRWEEEAASLTPEQEQAMVHLRDQVEQGRAEPEAFAELWNSYHPNRAERYLFHLGEAIDDLLTEWRSAGAGQSSSTN